MEEWFEEALERFRREFRRILREAEELLKPISDIGDGEVEPLYEVVDRPGEVLIRVDLPGVKRKEDVYISGHGNIISIRARISKPVRLYDIPFYSGCEIRGYRLEIELAGNVDLEKARASLRHGHLEIRVPKRRAFRVKVE